MLPVVSVLVGSLHVITACSDSVARGSKSPWPSHPLAWDPLGSQELVEENANLISELSFHVAKCATRSVFYSKSLYVIALEFLFIISDIP